MPSAHAAKPRRRGARIREEPVTGYRPSGAQRRRQVQRLFGQCPVARALYPVVGDAPCHFGIPRLAGGDTAPGSEPTMEQAFIHLVQQVDADAAAMEVA